MLEITATVDNAQPPFVDLLDSVSKNASNLSHDVLQFGTWILCIRKCKGLAKMIGLCSPGPGCPRVILVVGIALMAPQNAR